MIKISSLTKNYGDHTALSDVSVEISQGSIFGLLGPNGAGKTTLIRIINQIIEQDSGDIFIKGEQLSPKHIPIIGYLPEERGLYKKMKVGEQLIFFGQLRGLSRSECVERIKKWTKKLQIYDWINHKVEDLSKGMAQKIQVIASILHEPEIIILDEPFSGFDPVNANLIKDEILNFKKNGHTIIFSTHRMESAEELCDDICLINNSKVLINESKKKIRDSFRDSVYVIEHRPDFTFQNSDYTLISKHNSKDFEDGFISKVKVENKSGNELIKEITKSCEVLSFKEDIPSLNDIFIKLTTSGNE